ncbi:DUF6069 family protein [Pseudonocardia saturnea]
MSTPVDHPSAPTTAPLAIRRGFSVLGAVAAPVVVWCIAGPLAGIEMTADVAGAPTPVGPVAVVVAALAAGLAGWGLLVVLERSTRHARTAWTWTAVTVLALSLAGPLISSASGPAGTGVLAAMHLACGAVLIGLLPRRSAR